MLVNLWTFRISPEREHIDNLATVDNACRHHAYSKFPHLRPTPHYVPQPLTTGIQMAYNPVETPVMNKRQAAKWSSIVGAEHAAAISEVDLMFILDATLSMKDAMDAVKTKLTSEFVEEIYLRLCLHSVMVRGA